LDRLLINAAISKVEQLVGDAIAKGAKILIGGKHVCGVANVSLSQPF